jgi:hypothetical protein
LNSRLKKIYPMSDTAIRCQQGAPGPLPATRGECLAGGSNEARPCQFIQCRHHLGAGAIGNSETCSLDVADAGEHTLEEVAALLAYEEPNKWSRTGSAAVTRERIRQIELEAGDKIALHFARQRGAAAKNRRAQGLK